jgi:hypothetical protein
MKGSAEKREPAGVAGLRDRIERWRRARAKRGRMPEALWQSAAELARRHGINRIAAPLRLDFYALKKRVDGAGPQRTNQAAPRSPAFVEVRPAPAVSGCVLEIEEPGGAKLTVRSSSPLEVVAVAEAFWRRQR